MGEEGGARLPEGRRERWVLRFRSRAVWTPLPVCLRPATLHCASLCSLTVWLPRPGDEILP